MRNRIHHPKHLRRQASTSAFKQMIFKLDERRFDLLVAIGCKAANEPGTNFGFMGSRGR